MSKVLVVDDEAAVRSAFEDLLVSEGHDVVTASSADRALVVLEATPPELVIMDICLPGMSGLEALGKIKAAYPRLPVIVMTGRGTMETAIEATKQGAFDYQLKPFDPEKMLEAVGRALAGARIMQREVALGPEIAAAASDAIIGQSDPMQTVFKTIGRVAQTDATVLIRGESGTGKELVARAIYQHSLRAARPLHVVNCAAIPETLLESELFGFERGAFTGAYARRIGKLEQAADGTLFLDEIGDLSLPLQAKLLRVLENHSFERLGGNEPIQVDVRVIAATNRDLEQAMAAGQFRSDLFHRLNVVTIRLAALRDRLEDIPLLVEYFLQQLSRELKFEKPPISPAAIEVLARQPWPGNVRELENCIHRALILGAGHPLGAEDIRQALVSDAGLAVLSRGASETLRELVRRFLATAAGHDAHETLLGSVERCLLEEALEQTGGNQTQAAKLLGLARPTFCAKLQKHRLTAES